MEIGKEYPNCRYWGYEVAASEIARNMKFPQTERVAAREQAKTERIKIKETGIKASGMGLSKDRAISRAKSIEERTGISMRVYNHDYL